MHYIATYYTPLHQARQIAWPAPRPVPIVRTHPLHGCIQLGASRNSPHPPPRPRVQVCQAAALFTAENAKNVEIPLGLQASRPPCGVGATRRVAPTVLSVSPPK